MLINFTLGLGAIAGAMLGGAVTGKPTEAIYFAAGACIALAIQYFATAYQ